MTPVNASSDSPAAVVGKSTPMLQQRLQQLLFNASNVELNLGGLFLLDSGGNVVASVSQEYEYCFPILHAPNYICADVFVCVCVCVWVCVCVCVCVHQLLKVTLLKDRCEYTYSQVFTL